MLVKWLYLMFYAVWCTFPFTTASHRHESCRANIDCTDPGLTCTGAKCYCYMDLSPEIARYWACNSDDDCPPGLLPNKDLIIDSKLSSPKKFNLITDQNEFGRDKREFKILHCFSSEECPLVDGFTGYCYVDRA